MNDLSTIPAALALGSNTGASEEIFQKAVDFLNRNGFKVEKISSLYITEPVDCPPETPDFVNAALTGTYSGTPEELLQLTQSIEVECGRPAEHGFHDNRTLDLDIILFGNEIVDLPRLQIPHPRAAERQFVLEPLAEIAPEWVFPTSGQTVRETFDQLPK